MAQDRQVGTGQLTMPLSEKQEFISVTTKLRVDQQVIVAAPSSGAITVTPPNAAEAAGVHLSFHLFDRGSGSLTAMTVPVNGANLLVDAVNDALLIFSDGVRWFVIANNIA